MSRHRTIWDGGPSTWRQRGGSRRACVRWRSWVLTNAPHSKGTLPVYWAAMMWQSVETAQGVGGGWSRQKALMTVDGVDTKITALKLAVGQGKLDVIRVLAQCGANVDASTDDDDGNKAAHLTAH